MIVHFVTCPKQGSEMEAVVLRRVGFLAYSCPKQGQDFKRSATPLYPNMGQVPPRGCFHEKLLEKAFGFQFLALHAVCKKLLRLIQPDPSICDPKT